MTEPALSLFSSQTNKPKMLQIDEGAQNTAT